MTVRGVEDYGRWSEGGVWKNMADFEQLICHFSVWHTVGY
jgi:hypothetical protein